MKMETTVKLVIWTLAVAMTLVPLSLPSAAVAKSAKWHCVALNPLTPWVQYCTASTTRP